MYCLVPQLPRIPSGHWYCPKCKPNVNAKSKANSISKSKSKSKNKNKSRAEDTKEDDARSDVKGDRKSNGKSTTADSKQVARRSSRLRSSLDDQEARGGGEGEGGHKQGGEAEENDQLEESDEVEAEGKENNITPITVRRSTRRRLAPVTDEAMDDVHNHNKCTKDTGMVVTPDNSPAKKEGQDAAAGGTTMRGNSRKPDGKSGYADSEGREHNGPTATRRSARRSHKGRSEDGEGTISKREEDVNSHMNGSGNGGLGDSWDSPDKSSSSEPTETNKYQPDEAQGQTASHSKRGSVRKV